MPPVPSCPTIDTIGIPQRMTKPTRPTDDFHKLLGANGPSEESAQADGGDPGGSPADVRVPNSGSSPNDVIRNQRATRADLRGTERRPSYERTKAAISSVVVPPPEISTSSSSIAASMVASTHSDALSSKPTQDRSTDDSAGMLAAARPDQSAARSAREASPPGPGADDLAETADQADIAPNLVAATNQPKVTISRAASKHDDQLVRLSSSAIRCSNLAWPGEPDGLRDSRPVTTQVNTEMGISSSLRAGEGGNQQMSVAPSVPSNVGNITSPSSPIQQLGHVLAALHSGPDGSSHITIRLDPGDLGSVQIRITHGHDGTASISVVVEKPETLRTFQTDLSSLHHALDRAGLPNQRNVALHLASPDSAFDNRQTSASGEQGRHPQQGGARHDKHPMTSKLTSPFGDAGKLQVDPPLARWFRAGMNITA